MTYRQQQQDLGDRGAHVYENEGGGQRSVPRLQVTDRVREDQVPGHDHQQQQLGRLPEHGPDRIPRVEVRRHSRSVHRGHVSPDPVDDQLKDGDTFKIRYRVIEDQAADAADDHGRYDRRPSFVENLLRELVFRSRIAASRHHDSADDDDDSRKPHVDGDRFV